MDDSFEGSPINTDGVRNQHVTLINLSLDMAPIHKKNQREVPNIDYSALRESRAKNLDLWVKGELYPIDPVSHSHPDFNTITGLCRLYPVDPMSHSHPDFNTITGLCRFVCHGNSGLLGYCKKLEGDHISLEQKIQDLNAKLHQLHHSNMFQYHENMRLNQTIVMLNQKHVDKLLEEKSNSTKEIEELKTDICRLQKRLSMIKETPMGFRSRSKKLKPISCLEKTGGIINEQSHLVLEIISIGIINERSHPLDLVTSKVSISYPYYI